MASFYANPAVGGDGTTTTDDANASTGLKNGGHRTRLIPMFTNVVNIAVNAAASAAAALASASSAILAPGTSATSVTNQTPTVASKSFTLAQTGKLFSQGQFVTVYESTNNWFAGQITAFNSGTGAITVNSLIIGSTPGASTSWTVALTAPMDASVAGRVTALETEKTRLNSRNRLLYKELL